MEEELERFLNSWKRDIQLATKSLSSENEDYMTEKNPLMKLKYVEVFDTLATVRDVYA